MQEFFTVKENIPVIKETDVIVIGGGIAGIAAALAARRNNAKVTLIEKSTALGGLATLGHVCIYLAICDGAGHKIYGGIAEELLHLSIKYGPNNLPKEWKYREWEAVNPSGRYRTHFNIPAFILALDELFENEGIDIVFDSVFSETIMNGNTCEGIIIENKSGRTAYKAKVVIDATGDADVFYRSGAECVNRDSIVSHWCYEIDFEKTKAAIEEGDMLKAVNLRWIGLRPDADNSKSTIPMFCGTTSEGVNAYIKLSRSLALDYLKKNQRPDYAMFSLPVIPQFRTTRMIKGKDSFKMNAGERVETSVGCVVSGLGEGQLPVYEFPYEGLIDANITNMLAAGRMVAAGSDKGWELMRFIPACALTGEASGTAAALAIKNGCTVQDLNIGALQKALSEANVKIHI